MEAMRAPLYLFVALVLASCGRSDLDGGEWDDGSGGASGGKQWGINGACGLACCFRDPLFAACIEDFVGKPQEEFTRQDLEAIHLLHSDCGGSIPTGIADLSFGEMRHYLDGIECLSELREINFSNEHFRDLSPLAALHKLEEVSLSGMLRLSDIRPLAGLINIWRLWLGGTLVSDISALRHLSNLKDLYIGVAPVRDLSPLSDLRKLEYLEFECTRINSLEPLRNVVSLRGIRTRGSEVPQQNVVDFETGKEITWDCKAENYDLSPLSALGNLEYIHIQRQLIDDISGLQGLPRLVAMKLDNNRIADISPLPGLLRIAVIDLENNRISDISAIAELPKLHYVNLNGNQIRDVRPLLDNVWEDPQDVMIDLYDNPIDCGLSQPVFRKLSDESGVRFRGDQCMFMDPDWSRMPANPPAPSP